MTVGDPIEYELAGIGQTQVNAKIELTFAKALQSDLAPGPGVIMIRRNPRRDRADRRAGLITGRLVLATLYTPTMRPARNRHIDMGVGALPAQFVVAGRAGATAYCANCVPAMAQGCGECACKPAYYRPGATGVFELLVTDDAIRAQIHNRAASPTSAPPRWPPAWR